MQLNIYNYAWRPSPYCSEVLHWRWTSLGTGAFIGKVFCTCIFSDFRTLDVCSFKHLDMHKPQNTMLHIKLYSLKTIPQNVTCSQNLTGKVLDEKR